MATCRHCGDPSCTIKRPVQNMMGDGRFDGEVRDKIDSHVEREHLLRDIAGLRGLLREVRPFVDPDATAVVDELARRFYRDTGLMAPGKSVALEMANSQPPDDVRREKYREWLQVHRDAFCRAIDEALADKE